MTSGNLTFASPWFLLGLLPVLGAVAWQVLGRLKQKDPALLFSSTALVAELPRTFWARFFWLPDAARFLALAAFAIALARPQILGAPVGGDTEGIDIVVALDISGSMQAADFQPKDRMHVAKGSVTQLVKSRTSDRIGLVVFAGEAASWVPLTLDYSLVAQMLEEVEIGMLPDGTAIGSAVATSLNRLRDSDATSKVVLLLTDGDNNSGSISPRKAAELAKELGVKIYTVLIGRSGAVPFPAGKDIFGRPVFREQVVPTNPELLEDMARTTGGAAFVARDGLELDARLSEILDRLDRSRLETSVSTVPKTELFPWFVSFGLALLSLELLGRTTRFRRFP